MLAGQAQGGISGPRRPFDQQPYPVEADLQQPGAEPVFTCLYGLQFRNRQHHACQTLAQRHPGARGVGRYRK